MKVGLFFGSFNPIHVGHLIIANRMAESQEVDQVWFVVSPQNPFKKKKSLAHEFDRLDMVRLAISDNPLFNVSDIEFRMPRPSFTVDTLTYLSEKYPSYDFKLIVGEDNLEHFPKWKNYETVLDEYGLLVYPRPNSNASDLVKHPNVKFIEAPLVDISATYIRKSIAEGLSLRYMVHEEVINYIESKKLYM
ncbi:nicotinate (nicotinamide) nucleotide adenylyltransferase [Sediminitomix flava]|uniref:Probable nicotinate-nucleotide adenylyltransferase n=1 Tax=Sediminitomix flava TaxID=379075 RepID=A0A315Z0W6_SEDFL|nr:nicotinate (nicotinamide) nucleotide adenylyltransferase [Sediminitomix flava]PWJ36064.1 nicotinate-nucleotide adenylyltransferase [Sediminitomix flava]